jgi:hypothetical protein
VGLNAITREAWNTAQDTEDNREKLQAMELFKDTHLVKLELLSNNHRQCFELYQKQTATRAAAKETPIFGFDWQ